MFRRLKQFELNPQISRPGAGDGHYRSERLGDYASPAQGAQEGRLPETLVEVVSDEEVVPDAVPETMPDTMPVEVPATMLMPDTQIQITGDEFRDVWAAVSRDEKSQSIQPPPAKKARVSSSSADPTTVPSSSSSSSSSSSDTSSADSGDTELACALSLSLQEQ